MSVPEKRIKIVLNKHPFDGVNYTWGREDSTFKIEEEKIPDLDDGQVLLKNLYLSNDPAQKGWMSNPNNKRAYTAPVQIGDVVKAFGIGEIVASKSSTYKVGDKVTGFVGWTDFAIVQEKALFNKVQELGKIPLAEYLGPIGLNGLTAYFGLKEVGQIKPGQTVVVSAASGATGNLVVQLAKHVFGAKKVIGITGTAEKCKWVKSIGADESVNYKDLDYKDQLDKIIGDDYVDLYFDNVGGEILSFMLTKVKTGGRVVACGSIAGYNTPSAGVVSNWGSIIVNSLVVQGFILMTYADKFKEGLDVIIEGALSGKIKIAEGSHVEDLTKHPETWRAVPEVWRRLFTSDKPNGKLVTRIA